MDLLYPAMRNHSSTLTETEIYDIVSHADHNSKISGFPFNEAGFPTKISAYDEYGFEHLLEMFIMSAQLIGVTLKDEIRLVGKDARLFRPQNLSAYVVGLLLFENQNKYLMSRLLQHPIFLKYVTPGVALTYLYALIDSFGGTANHADAQQWDSHFQLWLAWVILNWRLRTIDPKYHQLAIRYYSMMYNGYSTVGGYLFHLVGQPSGHVNTSVDNSIAHIAIMSYHAFLNDISPREFLTQVKFFACGDDLIWSDKTQKFSAKALDLTYQSVGTYLEFGSWEACPLADLRFVSTQPVFFDLGNGDSELSYSYHADKLLASALLNKIKQKPLDHLAKLASIARLLYGQPEHFRFVKNLFDATLENYKFLKLVDPDSANVCGLQACLDDREVRRAYLDWD